MTKNTYRGDATLLLDRQRRFTTPAIWYPDAIIGDVIDTGMESTYFLKIFSYISYYRTFSFKVVLPFKHLCGFVGIPINKHLGEKIPEINEVFNALYECGIVLEDIEFKTINDICETDLNPAYFSPSSKVHKEVTGYDGFSFKSITEDVYFKVRDYNKDNYNPERRSISSDKLLLVYMHLLTKILFRTDDLTDKRQWHKHPLGGIFTIKDVADELDLSINDVKTACEILKEDLQLIFYGTPFKMCIEGRSKIRTLATPFVEVMPANDGRLDWQHEYINEHKSYYNYLIKNKLKPNQFISAEYPPEILSYINDKRKSKQELREQQIMKDDIDADLPVDELF